MLEKLDLSKTADEKSYEKTLDDYKEKLGVLQRTLRDMGIPVIIVIEGWNAAGITMIIHEIVHALDPRGYTLHAIEKPTEEERAHTFLWRFWLRTPPEGPDLALCEKLVQPGHLGGDAEAHVGEVLKEAYQPDQHLRTAACR